LNSPCNPNSELVEPAWRFALAGCPGPKNESQRWSSPGRPSTSNLASRQPLGAVVLLQLGATTNGKIAAPSLVESAGPGQSWSGRSGRIGTPPRVSPAPTGGSTSCAVNGNLPSVQVLSAQTLCE